MLVEQISVEKEARVQRQSITWTDVDFIILFVD